jgi:hypothetical protein
MDSFDWRFYLDLYPDLRKANINTEISALLHYANYGVKEKRAPNRKVLENNIKKHKDIISQEEKKSEEIFKNMIFFNNPFINILIRTSYRPEYFEKCINSILNQHYKYYRIIICYDKENSIEYLHKYLDNPYIYYYHVEQKLRENPEIYKFNLYCNSLLDKVDDGYIMFMDDDDCYTHNYALNIISDNIKSHEDLLVWKLLRTDKLIYPNDVNNIKLGEISTVNFCFHSKYKNKSMWSDKQYSDYNFYSNLVSNKDINFNIKFVDYILTQTCIDILNIGNFGN